MTHSSLFFFFFFNDTATTEIYTLSLHDALPISPLWKAIRHRLRIIARHKVEARHNAKQEAELEEQRREAERSEEHTSELQSHSDLVCRLLLEKKKINSNLRNQRLTPFITEDTAR